MMLKALVLLALAVVAVNAQEAPPQEAAPEPYSYGYQTETHAASEQRDPSGKVTGYYSLGDADGRMRRVEYYADESGFHAKVSTNEVGTKSENPADVEVNASEPTPQQFAVYQQGAPGYQQGAPGYQQGAQGAYGYQQRQQAFQQQQPARMTATNVQQQYRGQAGYAQQPGYGYYQGYQAYQGYPGYGYNQGYNQAYNQAYGYGARYGPGYQVGYSNPMSAQYYRSASSTNSIAPSSYSAGINSGRYVQQQPGVVNSGVQGVPFQAGGGSSYSSFSSSSQQSGPVVRNAGSVNPPGSSNYVVIQKRETDEKKNN